MQVSESLLTVILCSVIPTNPNVLLMYANVEATQL